MTESARPAEGSTSQVSAARFEVTAAHIALLRAAYVRWEDTETGAPCIDPKRPYGNSSVISDVYEIVHGHRWESDGDMPDDLYDELWRLHRETETVLQITLSTGTFAPGVYVKRERYNDRSWEATDG